MEGAPAGADGGPGPGHSTSPHEHARLLGDRWVEAYNRHDVVGLGGCCVEDVLYEDPALPGGHISGREAVVAAHREFFATLPDWHLRQLKREITPDGDLEVTEWEGAGTLTAPDGSAFSAGVDGRIRISGITRADVSPQGYTAIRNYYDAESLRSVLRNLGAGEG